MKAAVPVVALKGYPDRVEQENGYDELAQTLVLSDEWPDPPQKQRVGERHPADQNGIVQVGVVGSVQVEKG